MAIRPHTCPYCWKPCACNAVVVSATRTDTRLCVHCPSDPERDFDWNDADESEASV